jgi:hypothetical protein
MFAMAESPFLDGGNRLDDVIRSAEPLSGKRSVAAPNARLPDFPVRGTRANDTSNSGRSRSHSADRSASRPLEGVQWAEDCVTRQTGSTILNLSMAETGDYGLKEPNTL